MKRSVTAMIFGRNLCEAATVVRSDDEDVISGKY
jgi:hypothetical protein